MNIRFITSEEKKKVRNLFIHKWNSDSMVSRGHQHFVNDLHTIIAEDDDEILGLITFTILDNQAEIVSLDSFAEGQGIGTKLLDFALNHLKELKLDRIWLITTNDNCHAMRFYQKRGWKMVNIHLNAIEDARMLKPQIPMFGYDEIPILHEIEFEYTV